MALATLACAAPNWLGATSSLPGPPAKPGSMSPQGRMSRAGPFLSSTNRLRPLGSRQVAPVRSRSMLTVNAVTVSARPKQPQSASPLEGEALKNAVMLAGFSFEAYKDPMTSWTLMQEQDDWKHSCVTTFTSAEFAQKLLTGFLTVRLRETSTQKGKNNAFAKRFAVVRVGVRPEVGKEVQRWNVQKSSTVRSPENQLWDDEVVLSTLLTPENEKLVVLQVLVFGKSGIFGGEELLCTEDISLEGVYSKPRGNIKLGSTGLLASVWFRTFHDTDNSRVYCTSNALSAFKIMDGKVMSAEQSSIPSGPFNPSPGSTIETIDHDGRFGAPPGEEGEPSPMVEWVEVDMNTDERRALRYTFNDKNALVLAPWGTLLSVLEGAKGMEQSSMANFDRICYLHGDPDDTQVYLWRDQERKRLVIAFRGTSSTRDMITDISLTPADWNVIDGSKDAVFNIGGWILDTFNVFIIFFLSLLPFWPSTKVMVHQGFLQAYKSVRDQLVCLTKEAINLPGDWTVHITGHSLGGGLATLCAYDLAKSRALETDPSRKVSLSAYTFGSPRVGNKKFANEFNALMKDSIRVVNEHDLVPAVPRLNGFYHHVQRGVCLSPNRYAPRAEVEMPSRSSTSCTFLDWDIRDELSIMTDVKGGYDSPGVQTHMGNFYFLSLLHKCEEALGKSP